MSDREAVATVIVVEFATSSTIFVLQSINFRFKIFDGRNAGAAGVSGTQRLGSVILGREKTYGDTTSQAAARASSTAG